MRKGASTWKKKKRASRAKNNSNTDKLDERLLGVVFGVGSDACFAFAGKSDRGNGGGGEGHPREQREVKGERVP